MKKTVLIVDDEKDLAKLLSEQLKIFGYETKIFTNSMEAQNFLENSDEKIDLIISDVRMPNMTGDNMYRNVKKHLQERTPPLIFMTGYSELSKEDAMEMGAKNLLRKPFSLKTLRKDIEDVFDQ